MVNYISALKILAAFSFVVLSISTSWFLYELQEQGKHETLVELCFKFTLGQHGLIIVKLLFLEKRSFVGKIHDFFYFLDSFTTLYHFQRYFNFCNSFCVFSENKTNKIEIQSPFLRGKFIFPSATPFQKSKMKYQAKLLLQNYYNSL